MPNATHNTSPADTLAAIIAAGVAAYQASLPDFARDVAPVCALPYHARPLAEIAEPEPIITLNEESQARICLSCTLTNCVGVENPRCLIRVAQRAAWRRKDRTTKGVKR